MSSKIVAPSSDLVQISADRWEVCFFL